MGVACALLNRAC